jgi:excisionase family DNA binding protein
VPSDAVRLDNRLLTAEEVAELFRIPVATVYDLARARRIPHLRIGRAVRFSQGELEEFLAQECRACVEAGGVRGAPELRAIRGSGS